MASSFNSDPHVGIVHERFTDVAGSEQVVEQLAEAWPSGPVIVPFYREEGIPHIDAHRVKTSRIQPAYRALRNISYAPLLPLVPAALRSTVKQLHEKDPLDALVISHHAFAVGAARRDIPSLAYVHSPARWAWDKKFLEGETDSLLGKAALSALGARARANERKHVPHVTGIVANSTTVRERIRDWWDRDAEVIHPPVNVEFFHPGDTAVERGDYFISVGRMVPYKRVDLAVKAAIAAGRKLIVIGQGRDFNRVQALAAQAPHLIDVRGFLPTAEVRSLIQRARALIMPGEEDFGIVPVEATAAGTPVVALAKGGAMDSVNDAVTGVLVPEGASEDETVANFASALRNFRDASFTPQRLIDHAAAFSHAEFQRKMREAVDGIL